MNEEMKMSQAVWDRLLVLKPEMNWGDWTRMNGALIISLDEFCSENGLKPLITYGTQGAHLADSQHYLGEAVDVMFPDIALKDLPDVYLTALRFRATNNPGYFGGLGIYNEWRLSKDQAPIGGMHFDWRPIEKKVATWIWIERGQIPMTMENLVENFR